MSKIDNYSHDSPAFTIALEHLACHTDSAGYLLNLLEQFKNTESHKLAAGLAKFALVDPQLRLTNNTFISLYGMTLGIRFEKEVIGNNWDEQLARSLQSELADSLPVLAPNETVSPYSERILFTEELSHRINDAYRTDPSCTSVAYEISRNLYSDSERRQAFLFGYGAIRALSQ